MEEDTLETVKPLLAKFRSQIYMGKYAKSHTIYNKIMSVIGQSHNNDDEHSQQQNSQNIELQLIKKDISEEMELVKVLEALISEGWSQVKDSKHQQKQEEQNQQKKLHGQQYHSDDVNNSPERGPISKWTKKKSSNSSQKPLSEQFSRRLQIDESQSENQQRKQEGLEQQQQKGQNDENSEKELSPTQVEILTRETILPLNLPDFFKKKEPHRLIVCNYLKCSNLLKILFKQLTLKKKLSQLQSLSDYKSDDTNLKSLKILVSPLPKVPKLNQIKRVLMNPENILVLYGDSDRIILTQKYSAVQSEQYFLTF